MWNELSAPVLLSIFVSVVAASILFYKRFTKFDHWTTKGVLQLLPLTFLYGNANRKKAIAIRCAEYYRKIKSAGVKFGGIYMFSTPMLVVADLELLKNIMVKDFDHFLDRRSDIPVENDPLAKHLFNMAGDEWKGLRVKLTPTFTSGKIKIMYQTLVACTANLDQMLSNHATNNTPADIKDVLGRFTTDIIGSCAFGLECNSMNDPDSEFRKYGKRVFEVHFFDRLKFLIRNIVPRQVSVFLRVKITNSEVEKFFMKTVRDIVNYREKNQIARNDFMHLLLQLRNLGTLNDDGKISDDQQNGTLKKTGKSLLSFEEIAAQCFVFFIAGFETSSTVMTFALLEMALNQNVQSKLRQEIEAVLKKHNNQLTSECVGEMKYLDCVVQESMRMYPPLGILQRQCTKEYTIPGTNVVLEKGTRIVIPIMGIQRDEEYFSEPKKFEPDRFNEENRGKIPNFAHMPFGEGPRNCIGLRFGLLQSKVGIATIIRNYKVTVNEKTKLPFELDPFSFVTSIKGGVWLNMEKLEVK